MSENAYRNLNLKDRPPTRTQDVPDLDDELSHPSLALSTMPLIFTSRNAHMATNQSFFALVKVGDEALLLVEVVDPAVLLHLVPDLN